MSKCKVTYEEKLDAIQEYLQGETTQTETAHKHNVSLASFQTWLRKYSSEGAEGLKPSKTNKKYSTESKYSAVLEYLSSDMSQEELCKKYKISSKTQLQRWILWYNPSLTLENIEICNLKSSKILYLCKFFELFLLTNLEICNIICLI